MKTEEIIKILLILGVLYLMVNCITTENFSDMGKIRLALISEGRPYRLVSFFDLKDEYKLILSNGLKKEYENEYAVNLNLPQDKKTNNTFLEAGDALLSATPDNISNLSEINIGNVPILIISKDDVNEYTKSIFDVTPLSDKGLSPVSEKYIYWNQYHQMLFYSSNGLNSNEIKGSPKLEKQNPLEIEPITLDNNKVELNKIVEKSYSLNNKQIVFYTLSKDIGKKFNWKWYTNDLSDIL